MVDDSQEAIATPPKNSADDDQALLVVSTVVNNIPNCCVATIQEHVRFNPMMVCSHCKHFTVAFRSYETFHSR